MPISLKDANRVVAVWHRHHHPATGHRFSLAVIDQDDQVRGVAIIGRPVARLTDQNSVLEVSRVATDGTRNACSALLGAAARAGKAMGYARIQTYTLPAEGGASLRGAGWECEGLAGGGLWLRSDGNPRRTDQPNGVKVRWSKALNASRSFELPEDVAEPSAQIGLFAKPDG